jgi:predicted AAA+ superfamily ATPase
MTMADDGQHLLSQLTRIADALDRMAPPVADFTAMTGDAFVWEPAPGAQDGFPRPVAAVSRVPLAFLRGIGQQTQSLLRNTRQFAAGGSANNALLWGARGMGKSSLVKAIHAEVLAEQPGSIALVEMHRDDLESLPQLLRYLRRARRRAILFCDDLSFDGQDTAYKSLKAVLDGGLEGRPDSVLVYATSNRRHLMPREMIENERANAINPDEAVQEKVSLSDRFGLWLGFYPCDQDTYLAMVNGYAQAIKLPLDEAALRAIAIEWAQTRGARSGRVAMQLIYDLAGRHDVPLKLL